VVNFQRDGPQAFISQGSRPNYQSTIQPLTYKGPKGALGGGVRDVERERKHENFVGGAYRDLTEINELDFEQPRALWSKVFDDTARDHYVKNVAAHFGNVKRPEIQARQLAVWAAVDQGLSDRIAKAVGAPTVKPLKAKPASESVRFKGHFGGGQ
jgi:catalase